MFKDYVYSKFAREISQVYRQLEAHGVIDEEFKYSEQAVGTMAEILSMFERDMPDPKRLATIKRLASRQSEFPEKCEHSLWHQVVAEESGLIHGHLVRRYEDHDLNQVS